MPGEKREGFVVALLEHPESFATLDGQLHSDRPAAQAHEAQPEDALPGGGGGISPEERAPRHVLSY
jgi:hypothetical protein